MVFKFPPLRPETRARLDAEQRERDRILSLPKRWFAEAILKLCREVRKNPEFTWSAEDNVYDGVIVWHLIPELAYRLGATKFIVPERSATRIRECSDAELLERLKNAIANTAGHRYFDTPMACLILDTPNVMLDFLQSPHERFGMDDQSTAADEDDVTEIVQSCMSPP